jgi:signal transduction histidine kinase
LVSPRDSSLLGFAFLAFDATNLAEEFRLLDRRLLLRGGLAFGLAGTLLAGSLLAAFHRLASANQQLAARSAQLARANRELSLAARTSAVGAVASHLVHGLRNPLAALQHAVASGTPSASDAADSARRMRAMIDDVVRVLRDEQGMDAFEVPMDEILAEAARRARLQAPEASGLPWKVHSVVGPALGNRSASLALLILENLCVNAAQALGGKGTVTLGALHEPGASRWIVTVEDDGPGIPEASHAGLFLPMSSSKRGGSGLGLALSRQIARHLGGDLSLEVSGPGRTRFRLVIPCDPAGRAASMAD